MGLILNIHGNADTSWSCYSFQLSIHSQEIHAPPIFIVMSFMALSYSWYLWHSHTNSHGIQRWGEAPNFVDDKLNCHSRCPNSTEISTLLPRYYRRIRMNLFCPWKSNLHVKLSENHNIAIQIAIFWDSYFSNWNINFPDRTNFRKRAREKKLPG